MGRIASGEAALNTGMTVIGLAVFVRRHTHNLIAFEFRLERTTDAAIGACRQYGAIQF